MPLGLTDGRESVVLAFVSVKGVSGGFTEAHPPVPVSSPSKQPLPHVHRDAPPSPPQPIACIVIPGDSPTASVPSRNEA